ncbi:MAG: FlgD immunoglobulin-like domain containing protein [Candidatus Cloacimonadaceae bacterium]
MSRLSLLLILLCLLAFTILNAQTVSKIELLNSLPLTNTYDYVTTWSDSLLHFYRIENTANTFVLKHWTCSSDGVLTTPIPMFTYSNVESWGTTFPTYRNYWKQYGYLYISFTVLDYFHLIRISEAGQVTHKIIQDNTNNGFYLFTPDYLYYEKYIQYPLPTSVHRYNLNTDTSDSLFVWYENTYIVFNSIDSRYLLISSAYNNSPHDCILIDSLHVVHPCTVTGASFIQMIHTFSSEILPNSYLAVIYDGLLRDEHYGVLTIDNYNINFTPTGGIIFIMDLCYGHAYNNVIPYGNGRFSCIDYDYNNLLVNYKNLTYNGVDFLPDNGFPYLGAYPNPYSLHRINERYAVAIAGPQTGSRQFVCIDYQSQSVTDSVFTFSSAPNINYGKLLADNDNLFYVYKSNQGMHLYILKIVDYTNSSDPIQPPQILDTSAWPNPFTDVTTIKVSLKQPEPLTISIFNLKGQLVRTLSSKGKAELTHELLWDGKTDLGTTTAQGLYIYQASALSGHSITGKIVLLK